MKYDFFTERILSRIEEITPFYAPEWKFDRNCPDAGSALALIFAQQSGQSAEKFNKMPFKHRIALYGLLGEDILPANGSGGFLHIKTLNRNSAGRNINKGFKFFSSAGDGGRLVFETQDDVFVTNAALSEMIFTDFKNDAVSFWADGDGPFIPREQKRERWFEFSHEYFKSGLPVYLNFGAGGVAAVLCDRKKAMPFYINGQNEKLAAECGLCEKGLRFYGLPEFPEAPDRVGFDILNIDAFENFSVNEITAAAEGKELAPDAIVVKGEEKSGPEIYPFGKDFAIYDDAAFFCSGALSLKKAEITLSFDVKFDIFETGEIIPPIPPRKFIIFKKNIPEPKIYDIIPESAEWEYFNGLGFAPLPLKNSARDIFSQIAGGTYNLEFIRPDDMAPVFIGPVQGYCVRARLDGVKNAWRRPARIFAPRISNVRFSCRTRPLPAVSQRAYIDEEEVHSPDFSAVRFCRPVPEAPVLYLGFDKPLDGGFIRLFAECKGGGKAGWQYLTQNGWRELIVKDSTDGFSQNGMISFTAAGAKASKLYGRTAGCWIRAVFKEYSSLTLERVYVNSVTVRQCDTVLNEAYFADKSGIVKLKHSDISDETVYIGKEFEKKLIPGMDYKMDRAEGVIEFCSSLKKQDGFPFRIDCRFGGGGHTNLPEGTGFIPSVSGGNIGKTVNPLPLSGGCGRESLELAAVRIGKKLRSSGRCVTAQDYLDIIDSPEIAWAECVNRGGQITLVILIKDYFNSYAFTNIRFQALRALNELRPADTEEIEIRPPEFVPVDIRAELLVKNGCTADKIHGALNGLCDPLLRMKTFGTGSTVSAENIRGALTALPDVTGCRSLLMLNETQARSYILPVPGNFDIKLLYRE